MLSESDLRVLLDYLALNPAAGEWHGWRIAPVNGGLNNLLFRASHAHGEVAAKFTIRDARDRAGREAAALSVFERAGLDIVPRALLLDRTTYPQPVIVQTWLAGEPLAAPPTSNEDWGRLAEHLRLIHKVSADAGDSTLRAAWLNASTSQQARKFVSDEVARLPAEATPPVLAELVARLERLPLSEWSLPPLALVRCDPNITNFIRRPGTWASVDWEYSGWGDPAYEVAEMVSHPAYLDVAEDRLLWFAEQALAGDKAALARVSIYRRTISVWWVARHTRFLYEQPRGLDPRLAPIPPARMAQMERNFERYVSRADALLGR